MKNTRTNPKCPDCGRDLREVIASSRYGIKMKLDQCFECGGIWFDNLELYPLPKDEIERIESIKLDKLQEDSCLGTGKKMCPKCKIELENFKDYNFPKDLEAEHCKECGGIWMNRGEAVEFKEWQEEKKKSSAYPEEKDKEFHDKMRKLLEGYHDKNFENMGNMGNMGKMLSLRIDPMSNRLLNKSDHEGDDGNVSQAVSTAVDVIYLLLRLFLGR